MTARKAHILSQEKTSSDYGWERAHRLGEGSITDALARNLVKTEPNGIHREGWSLIEK